MLPEKKFKSIEQNEVDFLLTKNYSTLMVAFYELQSSWMSRIYKRYNNIETANIICSFARNTHLEIIRQKEYNLNHDVSLSNFWVNFYNISKPVVKITYLAHETAIPKETVRRKVKNLSDSEFVVYDAKKRGYRWDILPQNKNSSSDKDFYLKFISAEISIISKFIFNFSEFFNLNLSKKSIEDEFRSQYSFYWYHFLSCQLQWLKMWQKKFKDNEMILIALQTAIPTLQYVHKIENHKNQSLDLDNVFNLIGKTSHQYDSSLKGVSAASVSQVTGIPRATCIRKLEKLALLGFLLQETKTKRFFLNQSKVDITKNILTKENVNLTIKIFSNFLTIILNSLIHNQNAKK